MNWLVSESAACRFQRQWKSRVHCSPCGMVRIIQFLYQSFFIEQDGLNGRATHALIESQSYVNFAQINVYRFARAH